MSLILRRIAIGALWPLIILAAGATFTPSRAQSSAPMPLDQSHLATRLAPSSQVSFDFALPLRNPAGLQSFLQSLYDPASENYRHYLTPQQFANDFGPSTQQYQQLIAYAQAHGLSILKTHRSRILLSVSGTAASVESAVGAQLNEYVDPQGRLFRSAVSFSVPPELAALGATTCGLNSGSRAHPLLEPMSSPRSPIPGPGSGPSGGFSPFDIKAAYGLDTTPLTGAGQTLGVFELDGFTLSDIQAYEDYFGLPRIPLTIRPVDGESSAAGSGADETTLDIELLGALAPRASKMLVYEGPNSPQGILDTYAAIADDDQAKEISTSWGSAEDANTSSFLHSENAIFEQMAAQGQSIFAATGDNGAYDDGSTISVDDPASQPYMTAVGGTKLTAASIGGVYSSETVWNNGSGSSGGGYSSIWPIPSYQQGAITSASLGSTSMRNVPDVSFDADPNTGYSIYFNGNWVVYGGTSCSAPMWAGFAALVNQERQIQGSGAIGFFNPAIYSIGEGQTGSYANDFHDVSSGTNGVYPAIVGYDDATGWGSFNGAGLLADLSGSIAPGQVSGPFSYPAGWNLFSLPYDDSAISPASVFNDAGITLFFWQQSAYTQSPSYPADHIRLGNGYWADFPTGGATTQTNGPAAPALTPYSNITLSSGWNQIGDPFTYPISVEDLQFISQTNRQTSFVGAQEAGWLFGTLYAYDNPTNSYIPVSEGQTLYPGVGYWIYATQTLTMQVPPP